MKFECIFFPGFPNWEELELFGWPIWLPVFPTSPMGEGETGKG